MSHKKVDIFGDCMGLNLNLKRVFINRSIWYLVLWFAFIAIVANLAPYFSNDFRYLLIEGTDEYVNSMSDVFISQYRHYFDWGGRSVAHVIAQSLLYFGKPTHSMIQGLCYITLILFIYYNGRGVWPTLKLNLPAIFFISMMLWLCTRSYGEVVFNVVSSSNYLYTTTLILIFILPFRLSIRKDTLNLPLFMSPIMLFLGVLAGWCNENTSAAVVAAVGLLNLYHIKRRTLTLWQVCGGLGVLIGFALLIFSPGNAVRVDFMQDKGFSFWAHFPRSLQIVFYSIIFQFALVIAFLVTLYKVRSRMLHINDIYQYAGSLFLFAIGLTSSLVMLASPTLPARSFIGFTVFTTASVVGLSILFLVRGESVLPKKLCTIIIVLLSIYTAITACNTVHCYYIAMQDSKIRGHEIISQLNNGQRDLVVTPFRVKTSKYLYIADAKKDPNHWTNLILKKFYKINSISRVCDEEKSPIAYDFMFYQVVSDKKICDF